MSSSDLLTLIGIVLAIFAFLNDKERKTILLRFSTMEKILGACLLLLLLYLIFFDDYFYSWGWYSNNLLNEHGVSANVYAFVIALALILYILYRLAFGKYPSSNIGELLGVYRKWLARNESTKVLDFIEANHLEHIEIYLDKRSNDFRLWKIKNGIENEEKQFEEIYAFFELETNVKYSQTSEWLLENIVSDEDFIKSTVTYSPDFYIRILERSKFPSHIAANVLWIALEELLSKRHPSVRSRLVMGKRYLTWVRITDVSISMFDVLLNRRFHWYDSCSEGLFNLGKKILHEPACKERLKTQYRKDLHRKHLGNEIIVDIIHLFYLMGRNSIVQGLSRKWYNNSIPIRALKEYSQIILSQIDIDSREKSPWDNWYSNFGLELIALIGLIFHDLILGSTFKTGNTEYVEDIIESYLQILFDLELYDVPKNIKQDIYQPFFNIYGSNKMLERNEKTLATSTYIKGAFRKILTTIRPVYKEREFKEGIKNLWEFAHRDCFTIADREEFSTLIRTVALTVK